MCHGHRCHGPRSVPGTETMPKKTQESKPPLCPRGGFWNRSTRTLRRPAALLSDANTQHLFIQRQNPEPFFTRDPETPRGLRVLSKGPTRTAGGERGAPSPGPARFQLCCPGTDLLSPARPSAPVDAASRRRGAWVAPQSRPCSQALGREHRSHQPRGGAGGISWAGPSAARTRPVHPGAWERLVASVPVLMRTPRCRGCCLVQGHMADRQQRE